MAGKGDQLWDFFLSGSVKAGTMTVAMQGIPVQVDNIGRSLEELAKSGDMSQLALSLETVKRGASGNKAEMDALAKVLAPYEQQVKNAAAETRGHAGALEEDASAATIAADKLQEYSDTLRAQTDPVFAAIRATTQNSDAMQKAADAQAKVTLLAAAGKTGSAEYAQAQRELSRANLDNTASAVGQQSALATLAQKMRDGSISSGQFQTTLDQLRASGAITKATADEMSRSFGFTAGAANNVAGKVLGVKGAADATNGTKAHVTVTASTSDALIKIDNFSTSIRNLNLLAQTTGVLAPGFRAKVDAAVRKAPGQATGGTVRGDRPYLVGERGPEIIVPGSGYVVPTRRLIDAPTGGGTGGGVVVNVTTGVGDPVAIGRGVVEALKAYERTSGTAWRS